MELEEKKLSLLELTVKVVSSHLSNNTVNTDQLPELIRQVHQTLTSIEKNGAETEKLQPVVPVKRSVFPDYIICLEDGKKLKMLKRHIQSAYGLTPEQYRERWNLPPDYPMVAPNYAERRSSLAREIGLGRKNVVNSKAEGRFRRGRKEE
ncbi:MucR family transcriptional regulator [Commensalibacter oyaizuii]|uniref:MucR family transcriptional regulator n=1 Tax=Commensalibacter oyaizuii TaxID=3043873 RepID=A0ABT6Q0V4_9PROT|nr:MucR family transcriptional regulator [Commensalibacter sp. TBRC 16381]MDI2090740.1 MucR family transcriptional regulator [Commensalibacter sp. TBRC 16381]